MELYFISPLLFHAPGSTVILCSFTHLFPSSLLMPPVVHRGAGSAPKQAESQWWCQSSAESQSHLNLSTALPPFPLSPPFPFVSTLSSLSPSTPVLPFLHLSCISLCSRVFFPISHTASVCRETHCFRTGQTLNPDFCFLCSPFSFFDLSQLQPPDYTAVDEAKHHILVLFWQTLNKSPTTTHRP